MMADGSPIALFSDRKMRIVSGTLSIWHGTFSIQKKFVKYRRGCGLIPIDWPIDKKKTKSTIIQLSVFLCHNTSHRNVWKVFRRWLLCFDPDAGDDCRASKSSSAKKEKRVDKMIHQPVEKTHESFAANSRNK